EQERVVAELDLALVSPREHERRRRAQHSTDEDHRPRDVDEEREVDVEILGAREDPDDLAGARLPDHVEECEEDGDRDDRVAPSPARGAVQRQELRVRAGLPGGLELLRLLHRPLEFDTRARAGYSPDDEQDDRGDDPAAPHLYVVEPDREPDAENERPEG